MEQGIKSSRMSFIRVLVLIIPLLYWLSLLLVTDKSVTGGMSSFEGLMFGVIPIALPIVTLVVARIFSKSAIILLFLVSLIPIEIIICYVLGL